MIPFSTPPSDRPDSLAERSRADELRYGGRAERQSRTVRLTPARFASALFFVLAVLALALVANSQGWFSINAPAIAAERPASFTVAEPSRAGCADIGTSSLRSPAEGLWFQSNCLNSGQSGIVDCNRTALDSVEFRSVAPGLYLYRQTNASYAYLWYATSTECFSLVSSRLVTSVCVDQTITFEWDARAACSGHGGVLTLVNGR